MQLNNTSSFQSNSKPSNLLENTQHSQNMDTPVTGYGVEGGSLEAYGVNNGTYSYGGDGGDNLGSGSVGNGLCGGQYYGSFFLSHCSLHWTSSFLGPSCVPWYGWHSTSAWSGMNCQAGTRPG